VLRELSNELLNSFLAKERCRGVSLLPWTAEETEIVKLDKLALEDSSGWVRKHAAWAAEVGRQEASARRFYFNCLSEVSPNSLLARLQILRPAITPACRWWHSEIEGKVDIETKASPRTRAVLSLFWYKMENHLKKTPKLFGRELDDYICGECKKDLKTPTIRLE
jgi:hypothetical protein